MKYDHNERRYINKSPANKSPANGSRPNRVIGESPDDPRLLDLLVDGELTPEERRELLARMDEQPQGWRSCALAFLEAQAWREDLAGLSPEDLFGPPAPTGDQTPTVAVQANQTVVAGRPMAPADNSQAGAVAAVPASGSKSAASWFILAASLMAAFGLGLAGSRLSLTGSGNPVVPSSGANRGSDVERRSPREHGPASMLVVAPQNDAARPADATVVGDLTWEGNAQQPIRVPVIGGPSVNEQWLRQQPPRIPAEMQQMLERMGHRIEHSRRMVQIELEDGRRVIVPVDQIDVLVEPGGAYQ